ncbi:MAG: HAD hydrolase family protein [Gammaproteobacteria bacterium]|nr:HAD hydrolase family protein [Gammaproteobacteria bacterium]NIR98986.1 HAD hydrolase family protein [Gammaproteobacteria bacterium]NIV21593.1 HAD hydrolase family protein [Gammaproteobacteria bacterium]
MLATGRTYNSLLRLTAGLALPPFHMITNGGAVGLTPGGEAVRYTRYLEAPVWSAVVSALQEAGLAPLVFSHRHPEPPLFYVSAESGGCHFDAYLRRNRQYSRLLPDLAGSAVPRVVQVAALGRDARFEQRSATLLSAFADQCRCHSMVLYLDRAYGRITEFFAPDTSKWRAFCGLFPEMAQRAQQVIAIGDEANDLEMIRAAGLGIAMGNATPEVRAAADRVTADLDHDGVALALEDALR